MTKKIWTLRDEGGFPAPMTGGGKRAQPFWSSLARVEKIIREVPAYASFEPYELSWEDFAAKWIPGLTKDGIQVGINWSGPKAIGYDIEPVKAKENVEFYIAT